MQVPTEIYDLITFYVENIESTWLHSEQDDDQYYKIHDSEARQRLANLRLVSKAFCDSASPQLFRHVIVKLYASSTSSPLVQLMKISQSRYAIYVRQIAFKFNSYCSGSVDRPDVEDLAGMLPSCLVRFTKLKALGFHEPPPYLSQEEAGVYIHSVVMTLRYVSLPYLEELGIHFPITHNFGQFFPKKTSTVQISIIDILQQLRYLELFVCAYTERRYQRYWPEPILPENAALPNEVYAPSLFHLIEPAINLRSLSIRSEDILNLDSVRFSSSLRLRVLYLSGVSISAHHLLSLVVQSRESLRSITFVLVKLNTETWRHVLLEMSKLAQLIDFYIESSGYSSTGSSSHLALVRLPEPDDPSAIETHEWKDLPALGHLQRAVNANRIRAGLQPFSGYSWRYTKLYPLETQVQELDLGSEH